MPRKKHANVDPALLAVFRDMVAAVPGAEVKGDTTPYVSMNGNMYGAISKSGQIGMRLGKDQRAAFLDAHDTTLFESIPGFVQKEYVTVPPHLLADRDTLRALFRDAHAYALTLKPKATKRS